LIIEKKNEDEKVVVGYKLNMTIYLHSYAICTRDVVDQENQQIQKCEPVLK
jgi:hypothetical protein